MIRRKLGHRIMRMLSVATTVALLSIMVVHAQDTTTLSGTVADPQGKVIGGAMVTLTNTGNNVSRQTKSGDDGSYTFNQVTPGTYILKVEAKGFKVKVEENVELVVKTPARLDVQLDVGSVNETVTVSGGGEALINTHDATIGNAFTSAQITQLPLEGRNVAGLLSLQPGVTFIGNLNPDNNGNTQDSRNGSVNGGKSDQANITLDGVDVNDQQRGLAFNSVLRVTLDSVEEFRVVTSNPNAEQGRSSGGQVSLVTKSGTNTLHGSLYEFNRDTPFSANDFFNNAAGRFGPGDFLVQTGQAKVGAPKIPTPQLIRNVFGGTVGGPILKDRLFVFVNYEGRRDARATSVVRTVPGTDLRNGIVHMINGQGQVVTLDANAQKALDPLHIGPSAAVLQVFQQYPQPNDNTVGDGLNTFGFRFNSPIHLNWNTYIGRVDYNLTQSGKHSLFWRGTLQNDKDNTDAQFPGQSPRLTDLSTNKGFAAGYNAAFTSNLVNVLRLGYTRVGFEQAGSSAASNEHVVTFRTISDLFAASTARSLIQNIPTWNLVDDVSWSKGSHSLQFGGNMRWIRTNRTNFATAFNDAVTNKAWLLTARPLRPAGFSSISDNAVAAEWGIVTQGDARYNVGRNGSNFSNLAEGTPISRSYGADEYEMYGQDSWRVKPNLTLTYGLRYSLYGPPWELNGLQVSPNMNLGDWFNIRGAGMLAGKPDNQVAPPISFALSGPVNGTKSFYGWNTHNFGPRFAFAYSPKGSNGIWKLLTGKEGQTVIRGGYGLVYDRIGGALASINTESGALSFGLSSLLTNPAGGLTVATAPRFTGLNSIPSQLILPGPAVSFPAVFPNAFAITAAIDDRLKIPYSEAISFSLSRELPHDMALEVAYVGRLGRHLLVNGDAAMPLDIVDPASGMDYFGAAQALARLDFANTPIAKVPKIAFWENLFPSLATGGMTATQGAYLSYMNQTKGGNGPDYTTSLLQLDVGCGNQCSKFGQFTFFNKQFSSLSLLRSVGTSNYHALQILLRKRFTHGLQFDFNYTFSKSTDITSALERSGIFQSDVLNAWSPTARKSVSDFDITHQATVDGIWELPVGTSRRFLGESPRWVNAIVGGWQLSGIFRKTSGLPTSVANGFFFPTNWQYSGFGTQVTPILGVGTFKNVLVGPNDTKGGPNIFANPVAAFAAYQNTLPGGVGTRNLLRGDGFFNVDMGLGKTWKMPYKESHSLQFRWEVFNVTNSVSFDPASISASLDTPATFGKYGSTLSSARVMQFGLRYQF